MFDGSGDWTPDYGLAFARQKGLRDDEIQGAAHAVEASLAPAPKRWITDRLTVLATMFAVGRHPSPPEDMAVWLLEATRLLSDAPHDILAAAIDDAVKTSGHGFMPSVGEIREIADRRTEARRNDALRLRMMIAVMEPMLAEGERQ